MQKLKIGFIKQKRTSSEIDLLLYLSKCQDKLGHIIGVHYKEVTEELHMSNTTYYKTLQTLEDKGDITIQNSNNNRAWRWYQGLNITLNDNDYSKVDYTDKSQTKQMRYLNTNPKFLYQDNFKNLRANAKLLLLNLLAIKDLRDGYKKAFYIETLLGYCQTKDKHLLKEYLEELKEFITVNEKVNARGNTLIEIELKHFSDTHNESAEGHHILYRLKTFCRQKKIFYTQDDIFGTFAIINKNKAIIEKVIECIHKTTDQIRELDPRKIEDLLFTTI